MLFDPQQLMQLASQRMAERRLAAEQERRARLARGPRRSFRRSVGRSLVRLGARLAADNYLEPAGSR
jgi:hypothetical protein